MFSTTSTASFPTASLSVLKSSSALLIKERSWRPAASAAALASLFLCSSCANSVSCDLYSSGTNSLAFSAVRVSSEPSLFFILRYLPPITLALPPSPGNSAPMNPPCTNSSAFSCHSISLTESPIPCPIAAP